MSFFVIVDTKLCCIVFDCSMLHWIFNRTETVYSKSAYKSTMKLTIANVQKRDYGTYKCVAKNPRGETDGTIRLYCKFVEFFGFVLVRIDWMAIQSETILRAWMGSEYKMSLS